MSARHWTVKIEPRDVWIGLFWERREAGVWLYICLVPCVVIIGEPRAPEPEPEDAQAYSDLRPDDA